MNVSGINNCTPLKPQESKAQSFGESYWEDKDVAAKSLNEFKQFINTVPQEENGPLKNFLTVVGIGISSAITAGFLAKKGMKLFPGIGETLTKGLNKTDADEKIAKELPGFIKKFTDKIKPDGKIATIINKLKEFKTIAFEAIGKAYNKFAAVGAGQEIKADASKLAANGIVNTVALASGTTATISALKDENKNGIADKFEQSTRQALSAISLADLD